MPRNLDHRVEVLVPVEQARLRQELTAIFDSAFADKTTSWELAGDGTWTRRRRGKGERAHSHRWPCSAARALAHARGRAARAQPVSARVV